MKTIGLIGGMSWESTIPYYRHLNEIVKASLGGLHSAKIILISVDFHQIEALQRANDWDGAAQILVAAAKTLELAGADGLVLCTNTMHKVAPAIEAATSTPLIHIADATGLAIRAADLQKIALLGTRFTMEEAFYRDRLSINFGLDVITPNPTDRELVHRIIYDELCLGKIEATSQAHYRRIIAQLIADGAQGVILGCTEISLLVTQADSSVPLFDTTHIHAQAIADFALGLTKITTP